MAKSTGKNFEEIIGKAFEKLPGVSIVRIPDQTMHYKDRKNVSDFIVYKYPFLYYVECKTVHGNTLPLSNVTQMDALYEKAFTSGVHPGVICWWVDKDVTRWVPIGELFIRRQQGKKSIRYDEPIFGSKIIEGVKKRIYFDYDMKSFFG